jgi:hypothetical protein
MIPHYRKFSMRNFIGGCVVGALALYAALSFHVVRAEDGHHVIAKTTLALHDTYVDIRPFGVNEWKDHLELVEAMRKAGKKDLVKGAAENAVRRTLDGLFHREETP